MSYWEWYRKMMISRTEYWMVLCEEIPNSSQHVIVTPSILEISPLLSITKLQVPYRENAPGGDHRYVIWWYWTERYLRRRSNGTSWPFGRLVSQLHDVSIAATRFRHVAIRCCYSSLYRLRRVRNLRNASFSINPPVERGSVQRDGQRRRIGDWEPTRGDTNVFLFFLLFNVSHLASLSLSLSHIHTHTYTRISSSTLLIFLQAAISVARMRPGK